MRISLLIPTRERRELLQHSLATALAVPDPDLEIIVSDNRSTDGTAEMLAAVDDPRLKVVRPPERVSMRRNFETALDAATGDHVIFIGDDDGVTTRGMATLRALLAAHRPDAVNWEMITYTWPSERPGHGSGFLTVKAKCAYGGLVRRSPQKLLRSLCAGRLRNYKETANIYHGCISRGLIERVRAANGGVYFAGSSPDVYAGIANLVHMQGDFLWVGHPVTFGGASDRSNGAAHMAATPAAGAGASEMQRFALEVAGDAGTSELHPDTPSLHAVTLDMLRMVDRQHAGGALAIDHAAWMDRIMGRLARMPRPVWEAGHAGVADFAGRIGETAAFERACQGNPFAGPAAAPAGGRPERSRITPGEIVLADRRHLATAADAARAIDAVIAAPHRPTRLSAGPLHWLGWAGALGRARRLARSWGSEEPQPA